MRRVLTFIMVLLVVVSFCGCGNEVLEDNNPTSIGNDDIPVQTETVTQVIETTSAEKTVSASELDALIKAQSVSVQSVKYVVQDDEYKALYPDMLQAVIANNSNVDIKNAVVSFVAWDSNNLPVKIKGSIDFSDGAYIRQVDYSDINLVPGDEFGRDSGFSIDENCNISSFKAIVESYETFDGNTWNNPYYDAWKEMYEGVKYSDDLTTIVEIIEDTPVSNVIENNPNDNSIDIKLLLNEIEKQDVKVISTNYLVQDEQYKALYPDMLQAVVENNSDDDIKNMVIAFVAWDKNKLPVKIKGNIDFSDGSYVKEVACNDVNLVPGESFGYDSGFELDENNNIEYFKAIVVSYETFDGDSWYNPCYDDWSEYYGDSRYLD